MLYKEIILDMWLRWQEPQRLVYITFILLFVLFYIIPYWYFGIYSKNLKDWFILLSYYYLYYFI